VQQSQNCRVIKQADVAQLEFNLNLIYPGGYFLIHHILPSQENSTEKPLRVLFVGNSYTYMNSLPTIFQEIAVGAGHPRPIVESDAPDGYTFAEHLASSSTRLMISKQTWDVVVMQEQSEIPAIAQSKPEVNMSFVESFDGLYKLMEESSPEAQVILFETWARNADLWANPTADLLLDGRDPADMTQRLKAGYEEARQSVLTQGRYPVEIARVGELWDINYHSDTPIRLHDSDGSHPNFAGSYLAALDIYATIYGQVPKDLTYYGSLGKEEASILMDLVRRNFPEIHEQ
jgi:hypothetical protein